LSCSFAAVPHTEAELVGTKGRIYLDLPFVNRPGRTGQVTVRRSGTSEATFSDVAGGEETEVVTFERIDAYQCQVEALEAQILDKAQAELPLSESRGNVAAVAALYESARQNRIITLPEVTAKS
jgi:predicted dehydrogenase